MSTLEHKKKLLIQRIFFSLIFSVAFLQSCLVIASGYYYYQQPSTRVYQNSSPTQYYRYQTTPQTRQYFYGPQQTRQTYYYSPQTNRYSSQQYINRKSYRNQRIYRIQSKNNQQIYRGSVLINRSIVVLCQITNKSTGEQVQQIYRSPSQVRQPNSRTYQQSYTNRYSAPQLNSPSRTVNPYNPYSRTGQTSSSLIYQRQLPQQTQKYKAPVYQYQRQGTNPQSMQATLKQQALADHDTLVRINGGWREHPLPVSTQKMLEHLPTAERNHIFKLQ